MREEKKNVDRKEDRRLDNINQKTDKKILDDSSRQQNQKVINATSGTESGSSQTTRLLRRLVYLFIFKIKYITPACSKWCLERRKRYSLR